MGSGRYGLCRAARWLVMGMLFFYLVGGDCVLIGGDLGAHLGGDGRIVGHGVVDVHGDAEQEHRADGGHADGLAHVAHGGLKAAGLTDEICMQLIKGYLEKFGESKASEITEAVEDALPGQLSKMQKSRKVSNILQKMKKNGMADTKGKGAGALWFILYN